MRGDRLPLTKERKRGGVESSTRLIFMKMRYEKLYLERKKRGLSAQNMGVLLHISSSYYWQIENKKRKLFYDLAMKISAIFSLKPDDLFYEEGIDK